MEEEKKKQTNAKTKNSTWPHPPPPPIFTFGFNFSSTSLFCPLLSFHLSGFLYFFRACYAVVTWTPCYMPPLAFPFNVFGAYSIRFHRETLERERERERETGVEKRRGKFLSRERERKRTEPRRSMKHDPPHSFFFFTGEGRWKTGSNWNKKRAE